MRTEQPVDRRGSRRPGRRCAALRPPYLVLSLAAWAVGWGCRSSGDDASDPDVPAGVSDESDLFEDDARDPDVRPDAQDSSDGDGDTAGIPLPLPDGFGDCRPSDTRCSADRVYLEICDDQGHWLTVLRCDVSHILGDLARFRCFESCIEAGPSVNADWGPFCGFYSLNGHHSACYAGGIGEAAPKWDWSGGSLVTSCNDAGDRVLASMDQVEPVCPATEVDGSFPWSCRREAPYGNAIDVPWDYEIECPCEEGVFDIPEAPPSWGGPYAYGACTDTGYGRPDMWGDETTRSNIEELLPRGPGWDGRCDDPGTFKFRGFCLPIGVGWCLLDEHCPPGYRCSREPPYDERCVSL